MCHGPVALLCVHALSTSGRVLSSLPHRRLDCLVVGPGLGRDPLLLDIARSVIQRARAAGLPLVLDGDGLFLVAREPALVEGYSQCILTPNLNEFRCAAGWPPARRCASVGGAQGVLPWYTAADSTSRPQLIKSCQ